MASLKQQRKTLTAAQKKLNASKAAATKAAKAAATSADPVTVELVSSVQQLVGGIFQALQQTMDTQASMLAAIDSLVTANNASLDKVSSRPLEVEVTAGDTEVIMPARAAGFGVEYDSEGRVIRLVPEYATEH